jgi:hypothetical protein
MALVAAPAFLTHSEYSTALQHPFGPPLPFNRPSRASAPLVEAGEDDGEEDLGDEDTDDGEEDEGEGPEEDGGEGDEGE